MMPNKLGLGAILTMIFAPKVELRVGKSKDNKTMQKYTGCLAGLGHHDDGEQKEQQHVAYSYSSPGLPSYHSEHDIELIFDTPISNSDVSLINKIRCYLNSALEKDVRKKAYGEDQGYTKICVEKEMINIQDKIKENLDELLNK